MNEQYNPLHNRNSAGVDSFGESQVMFAQCFIAPERIGELEELRPLHLSYIRESLAVIRFAGVAESELEPYQQICYFLGVDSVAEAESFVRHDPYYPCYERVDIVPFTQKFPRIKHAG
ncbi:MAG: hypothetical protein GC168_11050 [Candidatus Hydrogenedens sp.]|nr:hypothetical protein [Candidatus Hydrogenedens sp.]